MKYYSLNHQSPDVSFREATIQGQAPDGGLYFPQSIPVYNEKWWTEVKLKSKAEIAFDLMSPYIGDVMESQTLHRICEETVDFEMPLVRINNNIFSLELFHGPTLAFKDVGARFMSRCLGYFATNNTRGVTVLVATSGDTGGAVASGFLDVPGVEVIILYPSGRVSEVQELQLTTHGKNIIALEVSGSFDDCQRLVKAAFADAEIREHFFLTSANSINVARWLPQQLYYIYAWQQWLNDEPPVISVPSGNFGNIAAGLLAYKSGLPVRQFIAACNSNDVFTEYLKSAIYQSKETVATMSNAMDVGDPSNFVRVLRLLDDYKGVKEMVCSESVSDSDTKSTIAEVYRKYKYLLDPHGAVAFKALENYLMLHPGMSGIVLETAHPVKFAPAVEPVIGEKIEMPAKLLTLFENKKWKTKMAPDYAVFKDYLLSR